MLKKEMEELLLNYLNKNDSIQYDYVTDYEKIYPTIMCFDKQVERALCVEFMYSITDSYEHITHSPGATVSYMLRTCGDDERHSTVYNKIADGVYKGIAPTKVKFSDYNTYNVLDNILEWYSYELHTTEILGVVVWNIYDISNLNYNGAWVSLKECAKRVLDIQARIQNVDFNKIYYTKCIIEWVDSLDHKNNDTMEVYIQSDFTVDDAKDDMVFFYGLSYNTIVQSFLDAEIWENEWKVINILGVEN